MFNRILISVIISLVLLFTSCYSPPIHRLNKAGSGDINQIWDKTVSIYLKDELWTEQHAYDAGHYLMVPLHAAFLMNESTWQKEFSNHVYMFMNSYNVNREGLVKERLDQLHYLYFLSRFMVLAEQHGKRELVPGGLYALLMKRVTDIWVNEPAWQWDRDSFTGGMKERIVWKLNNKDVEKSYYRAIIDEELFTIAIAADIRTYEKLAVEKKEWSPLIGEIMETAFDIFRNEGVFLDNGGWLFQQGVWTDSPSYAYAGNSIIRNGMKPKPVKNIAWDTSHSHRFPIWLTSLASAYDTQDSYYHFYKNIITGLEKQFFETVLIEPTKDFPAYRTTNFMDGSNGVYRWNYSSLREGTGYGPYELSGTLTIGWWTFLGSDRIKKVYGEMADLFPLPQKVIDVYDGPDTGRKRHPIVRWPESFNSGYSELIARLAGELQF